MGCVHICVRSTHSRTAAACLLATQLPPSHQHDSTTARQHRRQQQQPKLVAAALHALAASVAVLGRLQLLAVRDNLPSTAIVLSTGLTRRRHFNWPYCNKPPHVPLNNAYVYDKAGLPENARFFCFVMKTMLDYVDQQVCWHHRGALRSTNRLSGCKSRA